MKKALLLALIVGILAGTFQIYIVRTEPKSPSNPKVNCALAFSANCAGSTTSKRGFPLSKTSEGFPVSIDSKYIINFFIFTAGIPLLVALAYKLGSKKNAKK
jgi:hypothetical protein